jgi:hypothetical protein
MTIPPTLMEILQSIVNVEFVKEAAKVGFTTPVYFDYGHYREITNRLKGKDKQITNKGKKYPLIWLVMDFEEDYSGELGLYNTVSVQIIIACATKKESTTPLRIAENFNPLLIPVYNIFLNAIRASTTIQSIGIKEPEHTRVLRPYWDGSDASGSGNLFDDFIDAIQLKNLKLKVKNKIC